MLRYTGPHKGTDEAGDAGPGCGIGKDHAQSARRDGGTDDGDDSGQDAEPGEGT